MTSSSPCVLTINGGSSSIKFALWQAGEGRRLFQGKVDRIGLSGANMTVHDASGRPQPALPVKAANHRAATNCLLDWLEAQSGFDATAGVGHRVVHGMAHSEPERVTPALLAELHRTTPYDPDHLPREIELIKAIGQRHPQLPQVACFDTAFHRTMPRVARLLPIPRRYTTKGMQRYGFHGLSYSYLMQELARLGDPAAKNGRVILAHLGNGASLAAVRNGESVDTTMGFTPAAGVVMSSRSGDLDPGLLSFLSRREQMTRGNLSAWSTTSPACSVSRGPVPTCANLLARENRDVRAAEAVGLFCYQARKWIGSFAAVLGGVDTLVFSAGIGESSASSRAGYAPRLGSSGFNWTRRATPGTPRKFPPPPAGSRCGSFAPTKKA